MFMNKIKRQASSFVHDKYNTARLALSDVTQAELVAEEATNNEPCSLDARTMTRLAEASLDIDDYWRIVDVLHKRLYNIDWNRWRQSYKSLVLLDFLLTHGPEDFAKEFICDTDVIQHLGTFKHKDENGFDWGLNMQKKSERILELLKGGETLKQARLKALKITKEIKGFGNSIISPSSTSSSSSSSGSSSFGSYSITSSSWNDIDEQNKHELSIPKNDTIGKYSQGNKNSKHNVEESHLCDCPPIEEIGGLLDPEEEENGEMEKPASFISGICSKLGFGPLRFDDGGKVAFRSLSDVGKTMEKKIDRQFSIG